MAFIMDEALLMQMESEISQFEEWNNRLHEDLGYLMDLPATDENLDKIGALVDYYFTDMMFNHEDHQISIERMTDGGIAITVMMAYEDTDDYYVDFEIDHGVNFEIRMNADAFMAGDDDFGENLGFAAYPVGYIEELEAEIEKWHSEFMTAMSDTAEPATPVVNESADDILFAPITLEDDKKPETVPSTDPYYGDCG
jgi:hypothetical protein